jgi:hypothetical protein
MTAVFFVLTVQFLVRPFNKAKKKIVANNVKQIKTNKMKTKIFFSLILLTAIVAITSCNKKKEELQPPTSSSPALTLKTDKTTISLGGEAILTATTTFTNPTFTWSVNTSSSIIGSGSQVRLYASCPSCTGSNEVTCTVKDGSNTTSAKITITVQ